MGDSTQAKANIKQIIRELSKTYKTILKQRSVVECDQNGLKLNGISDDKKYGVMVCNSKLLNDSVVGAGQLSTILGRCYLLILSGVENKILVFTDKNFYQKFMEKYGVYLRGIEAFYYDISNLDKK